MLSDLVLGNDNIGWEISEVTNNCPEEVLKWKITRARDFSISCIDVCGEHKISANRTRGSVMIENKFGFRLDCSWNLIEFKIKHYSHMSFIF